MDRVKAIEGDREIVDGLEARKLGGHSPGSMAVTFKTEAGTVALTGEIPIDITLKRTLSQFNVSVTSKGVGSPKMSSLPVSPLVKNLNRGGAGRI